MVSHRYSRSLAAAALMGSLLVLSACNPPAQKNSDTVSRADIAEGATPTTSPVSADGASTEPSIENSVSQMFGGATPSSIEPSAIEGLKEIVVNGQVYYASPDGRYLISGEVMEVATQTNLTSQARDRAREKLMPQLNVEDAIVYKPKGKTKEVLNVFTDVECGYCREFHKHIDAYTKQGYEIHYYPWPRSGGSGPVYDEMVSVWCAKDQRAALTAAKNGNPPPAKTCDNPVAKYIELGHKMGVNGTPAVYLNSGKQIGGYVPADSMAGAIASAKGEAVAE